MVVEIYGAYFPFYFHFLAPIFFIHRALLNHNISITIFDACGLMIYQIKVYLNLSLKGGT